MSAPAFLFATGIESSCPTVGGGKVRMDEMELCGHYRHWRTDFALAAQLGIQFLRYGPPLHTTWLGPGRYDWEFADATFAELGRRDLVPIADLCHFGVPDWLGDFQNPDFPELFGQYAKAFAQRFPWVQLYTPINEMYVCAKFSALLGWWNEQLANHRAFVTALKHLVKGNLLAMERILEVRPDALFVQSESSEYFHAVEPAAIQEADLKNARRFLSLDLNYGRRIDSDMFEYVMDHGMTHDEYEFFLHNNLKRHCIVGSDYYCANEHAVDSGGRVTPSGEVFGFSPIAQQYHERYRLPMMHTETNLADPGDGHAAVAWLYKEWLNLRGLCASGVPVLGFTWYSLTDQVDWDNGLRERRGHVHPVGLFDLDRTIRPVGEAYRTLIARWSGELPTQSVCLQVPIVMPSEYPQEAF